MGYNDLLDMFKIVASYRSMLNNLEKRYSLIDVIRFIVEMIDWLGWKMKHFTVR